MQCHILEYANGGPFVFAFHSDECIIRNQTSGLIMRFPLFVESPTQDAKGFSGGFGGAERAGAAAQQARGEDGRDFADTFRCGHLRFGRFHGGSV